MMGMNAPLIQSSCKILALSIHRSVMAMVISSGAVSDSPNKVGKEMKQVKRIMRRKTRSWRSLSSATWARTGCATLLTMPWMKECPMAFHLLAWL